MRWTVAVQVLLGVCLLIATAGCDIGPNNTPTPAATATPTPTATSAATPVPHLALPPCATAADLVARDTYFCIDGDLQGYNQSDNSVTLTADDASFSGSFNDSVRLLINGPSPWTLEFKAPGGKNLTPGIYEGVQSFQSGLDSAAAFLLQSTSPECPALTGRFEILEIAGNPDTKALSRFAAVFTQICTTNQTTVTGAIRFNATVPTPVGGGPWPTAPPTGTPAPVGPAPCATNPALQYRDTYVCIDYGNAGAPLTLTNDDASFTISPGLRVLVQGSTPVDLTFAPPQGKVLAPGIYEKVGSYSSQSPLRGLLNIGGGGGCESANSRFEILELVTDPSSGQVTRFAANFEQQCPGQGRTTGSIRVNATLPTPVGGGPVPTATFTPTPAPVPPAPCAQNAALRYRDTYVCIDSAQNGQEMVLTNDDTDFAVTSNSQELQVAAQGATPLQLLFAPPATQALVPGIYEKASNYQGQFPNRPVLGISSGASCSDATNRFQILELVIDAATNKVVRFAANFEQQCQGAGGTTGSIRFNATIPTPVGGGPIPTATPTATPAPIGLPPCARPILPSRDTFVCIDYAGTGQQLTLTNDDVDFVITAATNQLAISLSGSSPTGNVPQQVEFAVPVGQTLAPGIYEKARNYANGLAVRPTFNIGNNCNNAIGRFQILELVTDPASHQVIRFAANFEQQCGVGSAGLTVGAIRYNATLPTPVGGGHAPTPTPTTTPAPLPIAHCNSIPGLIYHDTYLCWDSGAGEVIGGGLTLAVTGDDAGFAATVQNGVSFQVLGLQQVGLFFG
ncbi:MAG TPA: hypothetical protein VKY74_02225, partial [Chloroflexia bacterium]|nr:hypothetical protein [Chloroflexia bacterium]